MSRTASDLCKSGFSRQLGVTGVDGVDEAEVCTRTSLRHVRFTSPN
jgi:hypothetical protein